MWGQPCMISACDYPGHAPQSQCGGAFQHAHWALCRSPGCCCGLHGSACPRTCQTLELCSSQKSVSWWCKCCCRHRASVVSWNLYTIKIQGLSIAAHVVHWILQLWLAAHQSFRGHEVRVVYQIPDLTQLVWHMELWRVLEGLRKRTSGCYRYKWRQLVLNRRHWICLLKSAIAFTQWVEPNCLWQTSLKSWSYLIIPRVRLIDPVSRMLCQENQRTLTFHNLKAMSRSLCLCTWKQMNMSLWSELLYYRKSWNMNGWDDKLWRLSGKRRWMTNWST